MRRTLVVVVCLFAFYIATAQDYYVPPAKRSPATGEKGSTGTSTGKFSFGLSAGPAFASKDFGSKNVKNSFWDFTSTDSVHLQGFAKTGFHFNITASYLISENFGITGMFGNNSNPFDLSTFATTVGPPFTSSFPQFQTSEYLIGAFFSTLVRDKIKFEANIMIGAVTTTYPTLDWTYPVTYPAGYGVPAGTVVATTQTYVFNPGASFAYSFGASFKYVLSEHFDLSLGIAYTGAEMHFRGWTDTYTYTAPGYVFSSNPITHITDITQMSIGLLKPTLGIFVKL